LKDKNVWVLLTAIVCLTNLEICAMLVGWDGYLFSIITIAIAGIAGFKMPDIIKRIRKK
jgi:hypothetical protein